jgi:uncharacterized damage-inducible protein DinB
MHRASANPTAAGIGFLW